MKNFDTRAYSISDFLEWYNSDLLELSPDFQRRSVWTSKAKSYLIDTILRGKPIPKILIQQKLQGKKTVRIVVDGQQRLRTIIEFYNGDFKVSRIHHQEFGGKVFESLPDEIKREFLKYELGVDLLFDVEYEDLLDIFERLNSYTVKLKTQELYNAKYVGHFKQTVFNYGLKYVRYYLEGKILSKASVTRMSEAELTADLFVTLIDTVRTNKGIEKYYKLYEDEEGELPSAARKFDNIMSYIGAIYPPREIANTNWKRVHLFYSLFASIGHNLYGIDGLRENYRVKLNKSKVGKLRIILDEISLKYDYHTEDQKVEIPTTYAKFINYSRRATTDTPARVYRSNFICKKIATRIDKL